MDRIQTPSTLATGYADLARAEHEKHCAHCRTLTEQSATRAAAYGESIRRRDRRQLDLRRVRAGRPAVAA